VAELEKERSFALVDKLKAGDLEKLSKQQITLTINSDGHGIHGTKFSRYSFPLLWEIIPFSFLFIGMVQSHV
jgi:hypothetical protein